MKRLLAAYEIPAQSRSTFRRDIVTSVSRGAAEAGVGFASVVAKKVLEAHDMGIAVVGSSRSLGHIVGFVSAGMTRYFRRQDIVFVLQAAAALPLFAIGLWPGWRFFVSAAACAWALFFMSIPLMISVYQTNYPGYARGRVVALARLALVTTMVVLGSVLGLLPDPFPESYRIIFPCIGVVMIGGGLAFRSVPTLGAEPDLDPVGLTTVLGQFGTVLKEDRNFRNFMICQFLSGFANLAAMPLYVIYLTDAERGLDASALQATVLVVAVPSAGRLFSTLLWGWIFDRLDIVRMRVICNLFFSARILAFTFFTDLRILALGLFATGLGMGGALLVWELCVIDFAPRSRVPLYMSLHTFLTGARGIVAPFFGVWLARQIGLVPTFGALAAVYIGGSIMFAVIVRPPGREADQPLDSDGPGH